MWPKILMQLLPHLSELGPLVKRITQAKAAGDEATRDALEQKLEAIAAGLRQDISDASASLPTELALQLATQGKTLEDIAGDLRALRSSSDELTSRLARVEKRQGMQTLLLLLLLVLILAMFLVLPLLLHHLAARA